MLSCELRALARGPTIGTTNVFISTPSKLVIANYKLVNLSDLNVTIQAGFPMYVLRTIEEIYPESLLAWSRHLVVINFVAVCNPRLI
ncbi:hypothetical protein BH10CYA1_BH10CYA1_09650 [soil metagenome]